MKSATEQVKSKVVTFMATPELHELLKEVAYKNRVSMGEYIRIALVNFIPELKPPAST